MADVKNICKKCKWWYLTNYCAGLQGECRKNPPIDNNCKDLYKQRIFPKTRELDWCGNFKLYKNWFERNKEYNG